MLVGATKRPGARSPRAWGTAGRPCCGTTSTATEPGSPSCLPPAGRLFSRVPRGRRPVKGLCHLIQKSIGLLRPLHDSKIPACHLRRNGPMFFRSSCLSIGHSFMARSCCQSSASANRKVQPIQLAKRYERAGVAQYNWHRLSLALLLGSWD